MKNKIKQSKQNKVVSLIHGKGLTASWWKERKMDDGEKIRRLFICLNMTIIHFLLPIIWSMFTAILMVTYYPICLVIAVHYFRLSYICLRRKLGDYHSSWMYLIYIEEMQGEHLFIFLNINVIYCLEKASQGTKNQHRADIYIRSIRSKKATSLKLLFNTSQFTFQCAIFFCLFLWVSANLLHLSVFMGRRCLLVWLWWCS